MKYKNLSELAERGNVCQSVPHTLISGSIQLIGNEFILKNLMYIFHLSNLRFKCLEFGLSLVLNQ